MRGGRPTGALVAVLTAALLAACGSGEPPLPDESARVFLDRAKLSDSARVAAEFDARDGGLGLPFGFAGELDGPYTVEPGGSFSTDVDFELEIGGLGAEGRIVVTGDALYLVLFGENYRQPLDQIELDPDAVDPAEMTGRAAYAGVEEVGGTDTAKIEAEARAEVPSPVSPPGGDASIAVPELRGDLTAWVGLDDGILRRLSFEARELSLTAEFSDLGESFEFRPPEGGGFRQISDLIERFDNSL